MTNQHLCLLFTGYLIQNIYSNPSFRLRLFEVALKLLLGHQYIAKILCPVSQGYYYLDAWENLVTTHGKMPVDIKVRQPWLLWPLSLKYP